MPSTVSWDFTVAWGDTDAAGIVFYPNYFRWLDAAAHRYLTQLGFATDRLFGEEKIGFPLLETTLRFVSPLRFGDPVTVLTQCQDLSTKTFHLQHTIQSKDRLVAQGQELRAWASLDGGGVRAVAIPEEVRRALRPDTTEG